MLDTKNRTMRPIAFRSKHESILLSVSFALKISILFVQVFFSSCLTEISFDVEYVEPKLVVNSFISPNDTVVTVYVSSTAGITDSVSPKTKAVVKLYENGSFTSDLTSSDGYIFTSDYHIKAGHEYKISVEDELYGACTAGDTVPNVTPVYEAEYQIPVGHDEYGTPYYEARIEFEDDPMQKNYYEIVLFYKLQSEIHYITELSTTDPIILNEGIMDFHPSSIFFSDELFNGNMCSVSLKFQSTFSSNEYGEFIETQEHFVLLRSVSRSYYLYQQFLLKHIYNQTIAEDILGMYFKGEPSDAYSNVENGYGIFAGYDQSIKRMTFKNNE